MKRLLGFDLALVLAPLAVGAIVLSACGSSEGAPDSGVGEDIDASTSTRDSATPVPPAFEGGILEEDSGVGPAPDGGNDLSGCPDPNDPGGTEPTARVMAATDDCDSSAATLQGITRGIADTDMYRTTFSDKSTCRLDPELRLEGTSLEFCAFFKCKVNEATTEVKSCGGGVKKDSDTGLHGCCAGAPATMTVDWNCGGTIDEQSDIYFRVRPTQNTCQRYTLSYKF